MDDKNLGGGLVTGSQKGVVCGPKILQSEPVLRKGSSETDIGLPSDVEIIDSILEAGIDTFCTVADSVFSTMDQYLMDLSREGKVNRWVVPSERSIPAVAVGRWLATGKLTTLFMQNSGFSNAMDYLRTIMRIHSIPGLVLSGWRGYDDLKDDSEPHILIGDLTEADTITTLGESHIFGNRDGSNLRLETYKAITDVVNGNVACLHISPPGFIKTYPLRHISNNQIAYFDPVEYDRIKFLKGKPFLNVMDQALISRDEALKSICKEMHDKDPFYIVGNGYNPRAMQSLRLTKNTFENAGGMGSSLGIAWGAAKSNPNQVFVAIDGDQNAQMNEMEKVLCSDYPENLYWYILNNGTGESVGSSTSIPLAPWHYDLARVINTHNDVPGSFNYPRINATGLKFESEEARLIAKRLGNLPAEALLARKVLEDKEKSRK